MQDKAKERIAVVGAGASGIVCARELAKRGWENVVVLEASDQPGGKTRSITLEHPDSRKPEVLELGTLTILVGPVLDEILQETGLDKELRNLPRVKVRNPSESKDYHPIFSPTSQPISLPRKSAEMLGFIRKINRVKQLDKPGFKGLPGANLSLPIEDWFKQNDFECAKNIAMPVISSGLCGMDYDRVPVAYMIKMYKIMLRNPLWRNALTLLRSVKAGNDEIWRRAAVGLDVRYGQSVQSMQVGHGKVHVTTRTKDSLTFDRVIWTGGLPGLGRLLGDQADSAGAPALSRANYSGVNYLRRAVFTYRIEGLPRNIGWIHTDNIMNKAIGTPFACGNVKGTDWYYMWPWLAPDQSTDDADRMIRDFVTQLGGRVTSMVADPVVWNYNPFFDSDLLETGVFDGLENDQGKDGIYICGETLSGITLPAVTEYAKAMVERHF